MAHMHIPHTRLSDLLRAVLFLVHARVVYETRHYGSRWETLIHRSHENAIDLLSHVARDAHDVAVHVPHEAGPLPPGLVLERAHGHRPVLDGALVRRVHVLVGEADLQWLPLGGRRVRQVHLPRELVRLPLVPRRERDGRRPALQLRPPAKFKPK